MLRSRTPPGTEIRASTHQYHPKHLVYDTSSAHDWHGGTLKRVQRHLGSLIPHDLQGGYQLLLGGAPRDRESDILPVVRWMQQHGVANGFRPPTALERARATGHSTYLSDLLRVGRGSFSERDLYDWTGNHFDPDAIVIRILEPLRALTGSFLGHDFLPPPALLAGYYTLRDATAREGLQVREHPVPTDLLCAFSYATDTAARTAGMGGAELAPALAHISAGNSSPGREPTSLLADCGTSGGR